MSGGVRAGPVHVPLQNADARVAAQNRSGGRVPRVPGNVTYKWSMRSTFCVFALWRAVSNPQWSHPRKFAPGLSPLWSLSLLGAQIETNQPRQIPHQQAAPGQCHGAPGFPAFQHAGLGQQLVFFGRQLDLPQ